MSGAPASPRSSRATPRSTAQAEAARCLACGVCSECLSLQLRLRRDAINHDMVARTETIPRGRRHPGAGLSRPTTPSCRRSTASGATPTWSRRCSSSGCCPPPARPSVTSRGPPTTSGRRGSPSCSASAPATRRTTTARPSAACTPPKKPSWPRSTSPTREVHVFMMDMRAFSKGYEELLPARASRRYGIQYLRCRISGLQEDPDTAPAAGPLARWRGRGQRQLAADRRGAVRPGGALGGHGDVARRARARAGTWASSWTTTASAPPCRFDPLQTSRARASSPWGPSASPRTSPSRWSRPAAQRPQAGALLAPARGTLAREREYPARARRRRRGAAGRRLRLPLRLQHRWLPGRARRGRVRRGAARTWCTPSTTSTPARRTASSTSPSRSRSRASTAWSWPAARRCTHEPLFQDCIRAAGLNPYLFEMANIRNQCSWVHSHDKAGGHGQGRGPGAAWPWRGPPRSSRCTRCPCASSTRPWSSAAASAGMTAALTLAEQGFPVHLVEREPSWAATCDTSSTPPTPGPTRAPTSRPPSSGSSGEPLIEPAPGRRSSRPPRASWATSTAVSGDGTEIRHGVDHRGHRRPGVPRRRVPLRHRLPHRHPAGVRSPAGRARAGRGLPDAVAMIQCVGPAERYCSRICCTRRSRTPSACST